MKKKKSKKNIKKFAKSIDKIENMLYNVIVLKREYKTKFFILAFKQEKARKKMKKLETLKKALENISEEALANIINNEEVEVDTLTDNEKKFVLMFAEIEKAVNTKDYKIVLDCNYQNSKNSVLRVDYYRLAVANCMIQVYCNARDTFSICTSANKSNREKFATLENDLHFVTKYDKKTNRAKTTQRNNIAYDEIVNVIKQVIAVLKETATEKQSKTEEAEIEE